MDVSVTVKKDFRTRNRKFKAGDTSMRSEIDNFDMWKGRGFVEEPAGAVTTEPPPVSMTTDEAATADAAPARRSR